MMESSAVLPEGRISPQDLVSELGVVGHLESAEKLRDQGIWADSHIEPLKRIANFAHAHDTPIGIQLAHAGRKGSVMPPWIYENAPKTFKAPRRVALEEEGGWPNNGLWLPAIACWVLTR
jgi:2,4-dienoyl-CoA reductase-like NADH-dependent reductase (Old Yellow Enzyme family)